MTETIRIERAAGEPGPGGRRRFPFDQLAIGDAVVVPTPTKIDVKRVRQAAAHYGARHGLKLVTRYVESTHETRVWRTA